MADQIFTVLSDGDTYDGVGGTEVILIANRFPIPEDTDGMDDIVRSVGTKNVMSIHLDELVGDLCAAATGVIPRAALDSRIDALLRDIRAYLENTNE